MIKSYKHLTLKCRYTIEMLLKTGFSVASISSILLVSRSTIYRELSRNKSFNGEYIHYTANNKYKKRLKAKGVIPKLISNKYLLAAVLQELEDNKSSPEQISGRLKLTGAGAISYNSIYRYIYKDKKLGGKLYSNFRHPNKRRYNLKKSKKTVEQITGKKSIDIRPSIVNDKGRLGDWEGDLVELSKNCYLVTLTDRRSKYLLTNRVKNKDSNNVSDSVIDSFFNIKEPIKTITFDNGTEFSKFRKMESELNTDIYFAHPYASWERGLNEHTNGLIRQFLPKRGKNKAKNVSYKTLEKIENMLNNRPRKVLNFKTPKEVFYNMYPKLCCT